MQNSEKMLEVKRALESLGHVAFCSSFAEDFISKDYEQKEKLKIYFKNNHDALRKFWAKMQGADALLVLNLETHGIKNYIGGSALMEIGFSHVLGQKLFLYNPVPDSPHHKSEIVAMNPIIINGDLNLIN